MTEIDFVNKFLAKNREYKLLFLISTKYSNYSSINTLYEKEFILVKTYSSLEDIINFINISGCKRILIDLDINIDFNHLKICNINIPDFRIFLINNINKKMKLTLHSNKYLSVNFFQSIDDYYFVGAILQLHNLNEKLYIGLSDIHGFGVFNNSKIIKNEVLFKLFGEKTNIEDKKVDSFQGEWNALSENVLLIRKERTIYGFINHSRTPNCFIDHNELTVKAIRDIDNKEEITLDYREEPLPNKYKNGHGSTYL